jgi:hypothetical protein
VIVPELYLDNSAVLGTGLLLARSFSSGVEAAWSGRTVTGYLSEGADVDDGAATGLSWTFTEEGSTGRYWAELTGSAITTHGASYVGPATPLYVHVVSGSDYHEVGGPVVIKGVRPLTGFPTSLVWENDFFFRFTLTRQRLTDGVKEAWTGAALEVFFATSNGQSATAVHGSLAKTVGSGITELGGGEYVGGFEGGDITAHLSAGAPIYAIAKVGQSFRAAAQLVVVKQRGP